MDILDREIEEPENPNPLIGKVILMLLFLIGGSLAVARFQPPSDKGLNLTLLLAFTLIFVAFGMGIAVEGVKYVLRSMRKQKYTFDGPIWYTLLKNTFVWWALFLAVTILQRWLF